MKHIVHLETTSITYDGQPKRVLNKFAYKHETDAKAFFSDMVRDGEAGDIVTRAIYTDLIEIEFIK
tara:strand:+ start:2406 stop:2603 length:198 start_codon:yes stop_codon:yes gene_type:complete